MDSAVWGLLGTVVGALSSIATTWLTALSMSKREQDKLREDRFERARAFQRQTLIELQDAIHDAMRLASRAFIEDDKAARAGKEWGRNMLSGEVDEGLRVAQRRVPPVSRPARSAIAQLDAPLVGPFVHGIGDVQVPLRT